MLYVLLLMLAQALAGLAAGIVWRWRVAGLLLLCPAAGSTVLVITGGLSDFSFGELNKHPDLIEAWMVYFPTRFLFFGLPVIAGGAAGFALRQLLRNTFHRCIALAISLLLVVICVYINT